jgi:hypothetical protein
MDKRFYTVDGKILNNIQEFIDYLKNTSDDIFNYHKEHFINWLIDIFGNCKLAIKLKLSKNKEEFLERIKN